VEHRLALDMIDRDGRWSRLACPALPSPLHLLAGVMTWNALGWRDRMAALKMRSALSDAGPAPLPPTTTVRQWLVEHGQTAHLIEMLWEPLAVAALNQPIDQAAAAAFAAVLRPMFGRNPRNAALALPARPLDAAPRALTSPSARRRSTSADTPSGGSGSASRAAVDVISILCIRTGQILQRT
jgi:hypothetical protein